MLQWWHKPAGAGDCYIAGNYNLQHPKIKGKLMYDKDLEKHINL